MEKDNIISTKKYSITVQFIMLSLLSFGFLTAIGGVLSWAFLVLMTGGDTTFYFDLLKGSADYKRENIYYLYLTQGCMAFSGFILLPLLWTKWIWKQPFFFLFGKSGILISKNTIWLFFAFLSFLILLLPVTYWNEHLELPERFSVIENSIKSLELKAKEQIEVFTSFVSFKQYLVGIVIMVLLPALGEELLFRGIFQPILIRISKSPHIGILSTAFLFSALHLQFYGFFPRFLFGVFFGYIVYYKESLWPAIFCHFINNGLTITLIYIYQLKWTSANLADSTQLSLVETLLFLFGFLFFIYLYTYQYWFAKNGEMD